MSEHHRERGLMSRLPDDATYWASLTERLVQNAAGSLSTYRTLEAGAWHHLARLAAPLAVGAAAAWLAVLLWQPAVGGVPSPSGAVATPYGFAPRDPLTAVLASRADAPTMATIMATPMPEEPR